MALITPRTTILAAETPDTGFTLTRTKEFVHGMWVDAREEDVHVSCFYGQMCKNRACTREHYATLGRARWAARKLEHSRLQFLRIDWQEDCSDEDDDDAAVQHQQEEAEEPQPDNDERTKLLANIDAQIDMLQQHLNKLVYMRNNVM